MCRVPGGELETPEPSYEGDFDIPDARIPEADNAEANDVGADYAGNYVEQGAQHMLPGLDTLSHLQISTGWQSQSCGSDICMYQDLYSIKRTLVACV